MFASPGPIYEPGDNNDFWNMSRAFTFSRAKKKDIAYNTFIPSRSRRSYVPSSL